MKQSTHKRRILLIAHNLRSCHNVGSLLRTAEGLGVETVYLTGYTPYPLMQHDSRLPHLAIRTDRQITKTALGAEILVRWEQRPEVLPLIQELIAGGVGVFAVEQAPTSINLPNFVPPTEVALIVGREVEGIEPEVLQAVSGILEIPMFGRKESFNVVQAAAMALYHCRFAG